MVYKFSEVATPEDIEDATSEHVSLWLFRVEAQRVQKSDLHEIKEAKDFDIIKRHAKKQVHNATQGQQEVEHFQILWQEAPTRQ